MKPMNEIVHFIISLFYYFIDNQIVYFIISLTIRLSISLFNYFTISLQSMRARTVGDVFASTTLERELDKKKQARLPS